MRYGSNPSKTDKLPKPPSVVLAVITHMPNPMGYYSQKFEVVKTCLRTMTQRANVPHWLMVWDNGSTPQFIDWLDKEVQPEILVHSPNIGKTSAQTNIFRMFPPTTIVCYSDDDMFFYPDWLKPQIDILTKFPNVSVVTGYPCRYMFKNNSNTLKWATDNAKIETGKFLPDKWEQEYAISIGADPVKWMTGTGNGDLKTDVKIHYKDMEVLACSHHCQFIGQAGKVGTFAEWDNNALTSADSFDKTMNNIGLRLSTVNRFVRHIGNVLDKDML